MKLWGVGPSALAVEAVAAACGTALETPFFHPTISNLTPNYLSSVNTEGKVTSQALRHPSTSGLSCSRVSVPAYAVSSVFPPVPSLGDS